MRRRTTGAVVGNAGSEAVVFEIKSNRVCTEHDPFPNLEHQAAYEDNKVEAWVVAVIAAIAGQLQGPEGMTLHPEVGNTSASVVVSSARRRLCASLVAAVAIPFTAGRSMAATPPAATGHPVAHSTGRFDYSLPAPLRSTGSTLRIYLLEVAQSPLPAGVSPAQAWETRLAAELAPRSGTRPAGVLTREFELPGVGPAAWMRLSPSRPDLVTLLAQRSVPQSGVAITLEVEGSAGREPVAERVSTAVAQSWVPGSAQGFSTGAGAFVIEPSRNERASESFVAPGIELSIQTETVAAPDDGESSSEPPPGGKTLLKRHRRVGGFGGVEQRTRLADEGAGESLVYLWVFAGKSADGAAPRVRLEASAPASRAGALDEAWDMLLATWHLRPIVAR